MDKSAMHEHHEAHPHEEAHESSRPHERTHERTEGSMMGQLAARIGPAALERLLRRRAARRAESESPTAESRSSAEELEHDEEHGHDEKSKSQAHGDPKDLPPLWVTRDDYDGGSVKSNAVHDPKTQLRRPGVRVHGRDVFRVKAGTKRYIIRDDTKTEYFDTVTRDINGDGNGKPEVALNPARSKSLTIDGKSVPCVLAWSRGSGPAWVDIQQIEGNTSVIRAAVDSRAQQWKPQTPSPDGASFRRFKATPPKLGAIEHRLVLDDQQHHANKVTDYLFRDPYAKHDEHHEKKPPKSSESSDSASAATNLHDHTGYYNVCLNLPQHGTPPVAVDLARPNDPFFIAKGSTFRREVATFAGKGKHDLPTKSSQWMTWVFGFLGKTDAKGQWVPDPGRLGWVPAAVLTDSEH